MYLNGNKYTEKRVAKSHNVLRLKGEFVDKYAGLHVRSLYNDSSALNFDIVKKTSHNACLVTITTSKFNAIVAMKK